LILFIMKNKKIGTTKIIFISVLIYFLFTSFSLASNKYIFYDIDESSNRTPPRYSINIEEKEERLPAKIKLDSNTADNYNLIEENDKTTKTITTNQGSFDAKIFLDKSTAKSNEQVKLTFEIFDINFGDKKINSLSGKIKYDDKIFEQITVEGFSNSENWSTSYNKSDCKFISTNLDPKIDNDNKIIVFTINLKIKDKITKDQNTTIKFEDISSSDGCDVINIGNKSTSLKINVEKEEKIENVATEPNTIEPNIIEHTTAEQSAIDNTVADKAIPKTGNKIENILIILVVLIFFITALKFRLHSMKDYK